MARSEVKKSGGDAFESPDGTEQDGEVRVEELPKKKFSSLFGSIGSQDATSKKDSDQKSDKSSAVPRTAQERRKLKQQQRLEESERRKEAQRQRAMIAKGLKEQAQHPPAVPEGEKKEAEEELLLPLKKKKAVKRRSLKDLLQLAGMEYEPVHIYKRLFLAAVVTNLIVTAITLFVGYVFSTTFHSLSSIGGYLGFIAALWTFFLAGLFILYSLVFTVYLDMRIAKRRKDIEVVFPDFLQLAAANLSAGMTVDRALWSAIRPRFGVLAKEMEDVAKKTMTGYDLEQALEEFSAKYDSVVIKRSINLIVEGIRSGGKMADILNKIAINMQENTILQKEMSANVTTYVIFISFASILAAPILFGLATQLLIVIKSIAGSIAAQGATGGSLGISISPNVISTSDFRIFCIVVLSLTSIMSACMVSVIRKGNVRDGIRIIPFFWFTSVALYYLSSWVLGFMFSSLV